MPQTAVINSMVIGYPGMLADSSEGDADSYVSDEVSAEIPFGAMVAQGAAVDTCKLLASNADRMVGIVQHSHAYQQPNELGAVGLKPKVTIAVRKRGVMIVQVDEAISPALPVRVRCNAAGGANTNGSFRTTASVGNTVNISSFARFKNTTAGAGLALVEFDLTMRALATND